MAKKSPESTTPGDTAPVKRQHGKQSYLSRLAEFITELREYAEQRYSQGRRDENVTDEQLRARDRLRIVLADFPASAQKG